MRACPEGSDRSERVYRQNRRGSLGLPLLFLMALRA